MGNGFGSRLKHLRKRNGITQNQLASMLGVSSSSVGMYEQNRRMPDQATLASMCNIFNVSADYLLGYTRENTTQNIEVNNVINDFINTLVNQQGLMFNGTPLSDADKKKLADAIKIAAMLSAPQNDTKKDGD